MKNVIDNIEEYLKLANSDDIEENKKTISSELSPDVISSIINKYPDRKSWLVRNKHIPLEILRTLSTDKCIDVRFTIAMKKKCDRGIFETLMNDTDFSIRMAVVRNNKLPLDLLEKMCCDDELEIADKATRIFLERNKKSNIEV